MVKCEYDKVMMEGTFADLLLEVAVACQALHEVHLSRTGEDKGTQILETVAFALCSREEKERVLEAKTNELKKLTEGEKNE